MKHSAGYAVGLPVIPLEPWSDETKASKNKKSDTALLALVFLAAPRPKTLGGCVPPPKLAFHGARTALGSLPLPYKETTNHTGHGQQSFWQFRFIATVFTCLTEHGQQDEGFPSPLPWVNSPRASTAKKAVHRGRSSAGWAHRARFVHGKRRNIVQQQQQQQSVYQRAVGT